MDQLKLSNQVCFALYSASNAMIKAYRPFLREIEVTYPQYLVLLVLWEQGELNVRSLGEHLHLDSGTLTPLLKRLEAKNIITRRRDPSDERGRLIKLTPAGDALKVAATHIPASVAKTICLSVDELKELKSLCDRLGHLKHQT